MHDMSAILKEKCSSSFGRGVGGRVLQRMSPVCRSEDARKVDRHRPASDDIVRASRLLDNEIRILKEKIEENQEKIKLNKHLPYLVGNLVDILEMNPEDVAKEDGANIDLNSQRKGKCVVLKMSTHQERYPEYINNLPPPAQVAQFFKDKTTIDRIKIFDVNPDILRAFAGTGIFVAVTVPNGEIPNLVNIKYARRWAGNNIKPFYPQTKINYVLVGNEVLYWGPQNLIDNLVSAMRTLHIALIRSGIQGVNVTMAHSLGILESSQPPSLAKFRSGWDKGDLAPMVQFLQETKSPFMVNPYPYFGYSLE
ncbi:Glucan endo-1 [Forsythia ovata]|uniref:Glucan endo-1 n=1 Tax=Forsythia ovata TaxID=205694 RepID=A0ABD1SR48_9LAMI